MRIEPHGNGMPGAGRALVPIATAPAGQGGRWPSLPATILIATFGLATGLGGAGAYGMRHVLFGPRSSPAASAAMVRQLQDQVVRLQGSVEAVRTAADTSRAEDQLRGVRRSVETLKQEIEQVRTTGSASAAQLATKIEKADHDPSSKLADITARLDRIEHDGTRTTDAPQAARLADLSSRMDRLEKQVSAPLATGTVTPSHGAPPMIGPVKPSAGVIATPQTKADAAPPAAPAKVSAQVATVPGWVLRDVYDGTALVEARGGGLREVEPGTFLPGAGEVRSIERRGRDWVVMTSRGVIANETF